jgi:cell wall-associated NlpC family hydrolase
MAVPGTCTFARTRALLTALLLTTLAAALLAAAASPAHAQQGEWDEDAPAWQDEGGDWGVPEGGQDELPATGDVPQPAVAPQAPVAPVPPGVELPARPWDPPAADPATPATPVLPVPTGKTIKGTRALVRADGKAAIPRGAPKRVRVAIAAANKIVGKPYKWGGGHGSLFDRGYDCSGAVGYSLIHASLQTAPMVSGQYAGRWGAGGDGRWITVYANKGHVYMEIAGLRLDTSPVGDPAGRKGVRWRPAIGRRGGFAVRHPVGL